MDHLLRLIAEAVTAANDLNRVGTPTRNRELSLAITRLEEGELWTQRSKEISAVFPAAATPPTSAL